MGWQWHQLFLMPDQQCQSNEGSTAPHTWSKMLRAKRGQPRTCTEMYDGWYAQSNSVRGITGTVWMPNWGVLDRVTLAQPSKYDWSSVCGGDVALCQISLTTCCIKLVRAGLMVDSSWVAFKQSWPWPWPCIGSYGILSCISHRPLSTHQISLKSQNQSATRDHTTYWSDEAKIFVAWFRFNFADVLCRHHAAKRNFTN